MSEQETPRIAALWSEVQQQYGGSTYAVTGGDFGTVILVDPTPDRSDGAYVVKTPTGFPGAKEALNNEVNVLQKLAATAPSAPVQIPEVYHYNADEHFAVLSYVPSRVLPTGVYSKFTKAEQSAVGEGLGAFACWMADAISLEDHTFPKSPILFDDDTFLQEIEKRVMSAGDYLLLHNFVSKVVKDRIRFTECGLTKPMHIGHNDLGPKT